MEQSYQHTNARSTGRRVVSALWLTFFMLWADGLLAQAPSYQFALQLGGTGLETAPDVEIDLSGNIIAAGCFSGTIDLDPGAATANHTEVDSLDIFVAKYDATGNHLWSFRIGDARKDVLNSLATDDDGNVVVVGRFGGTVDFDPGPVSANLTSRTGMYDTFVAKYSPTGNHLWSFRLPLSTANALRIDGSGNIMIGGTFPGTVDFNPGTATFNLVAAPSPNNSGDMFVASYSTTGSFRWAFRIGGSNGETANAIAIDGAGNFYVAGNFGSPFEGGGVNFNPSKGAKKVLTSNGVSDMFIAKYNASRQLLWAFSVGGSTTDVIWAIATNGTSVAVTGMYGNTIDANPGSGTATLISPTMQEVFVAQYSSAGVYQWAHGIGAACGSTCQSAWGTAVAIDASGDVHVAGNFRATADFDPSAGVAPLTAPSGMNAFAAKYTATGGYVSAFSIPSTVDSHGSLDLTSGGDLFVSGVFNGSIDVDPSAATATLTSAGSSDIFIAKYSEQSLLKSVRVRNPLINASGIAPSLW